MFIVTPAKTNPQFAAALGRFAQACNYLEHQLQFVLTRMLPITTDMGRVLFAGNQMRRNIEILAALCLLPETQVPNESKDKLQRLVPRLKNINDDRSRLLHNPVMGDADELYLVQHKQDGKGTSMMPITTQLLIERAEEAERLWSELYIAPVEYDLSSWGQSFPAYPVKPYPQKG